MNVIELKQLIKILSAEIKTSKAQLRQDHRTLPSASTLQGSLRVERNQIRAYYFLYAFFRGKSAESVERGGKFNNMPTVEWYAKNKLPKESHALFSEWLKAVK